ncbi:MAG: KTSC domain-containing protein [Kiritimatiellae bacterium]|nr:KTSC domain-containing protein [Kiritimatiellia bacterium]MDY0149360.1 KTSC domain-containing protein [Kiritimatiellia bacterium]
MKKIALVLALLLLSSFVVLAADIDMQSVTSSLIDKIGYDAETQTLVVQMNNSLDVYQYQNVSQSVFDKFLAADSKGRYFVDHIKGQYTTELD